MYIIELFLSVIMLKEKFILSFIIIISLKAECCKPVKNKVNELTIVYDNISAFTYNAFEFVECLENFNLLLLF